MFDLKVIHSVLDQMEDERGISREKMMDAIEQALATAYKKEYGKRGQIIRAAFDITAGTTTFEQLKTVVDETMLKPDLADDDAAGSGDGTAAARRAEGLCILPQFCALARAPVASLGRADARHAAAAHRLVRNTQYPPCDRR